MKNLAFISIISIAVFFTVSVLSCSKKSDTPAVVKGCMDKNSLNYNANATQDDGSCTYPRDKFVGTWTIKDTTIDFTNSGTAYQTYILTIQKGSGTTGINLINFSNWNDTLKATVSGTSASIPTQAAFGTCSPTANGYITLTGTTLLFDVTWVNCDFYDISGTGTH